MSILVVGSVALDTIETPRDKVKEVLGGSATYFSLSASYFAGVNLVAVVGEDFPRSGLDLLKKHSIDLRGLETKKGRTFRWEGRYLANFIDRETVSVALNVFGDFHPRLIKDYRASEYVFLANINPTLHLETLKQLEKPKLIAADTMNHWIESEKKAIFKTLKKIDIFFINDSEARMLTGEYNLVKAGRALLTFGPRTVIIKKGEHGALLFSGEGLFAVPAYPVENLSDPTGAGDSFAGGFMGYLARAGQVNEKTLREAVIYGSVMASYTVEDFSLGGLTSLTQEALQTRYQDFKKFISF